ncbi:hypothetical protein [Bacillus cereus group sp. BfR-BA-02730]|uniref:hypothetical protein n=1 Tax=Bacillus cereus group sp. BfR-BA-02730 TaxID=3094893 RepID=UPI0029C2B032|nr:hypothetical protein [Bacillus cereus group sp. BfR-BA-02730]MDX5808566.1 hypothetical protein [Bacillus cereus group sp. BfR-BA-02730]
MCKFNKAWIGTCKEENEEGQKYCKEHKEMTCSVCGEQATHDCAETNQFVCGTPLCSKEECKLQHFYHEHGYAFLDIVYLEEKFNLKPFNIVVSKVNYGTGQIHEWMNEKYKDRLEVLLMTFDQEDNIIFYRTNFRYFMKAKEEIQQLFKHSFYQEEVNKKGVYYSSDVIRVRERYEMFDLGQLEKVI